MQKLIHACIFCIHSYIYIYLYRVCHILWSDFIPFSVESFLFNIHGQRMRTHTMHFQAWPDQVHPVHFPHRIRDHPISSVSMYVCYPWSALFDVQSSVRFNRIIPFTKYSLTSAEEKSTLYRYCRFVYIYYIDMFVHIFLSIYKYIYIFLHILRDIWREIKAYNRLKKSVYHWQAVEKRVLWKV